MQECREKLAEDGEVLSVFVGKNRISLKTFRKMYKKVLRNIRVIHENARLRVEVLGIS